MAALAHRAQIFRVIILRIMIQMSHGENYPRAGAWMRVILPGTTAAIGLAALALPTGAAFNRKADLLPIFGIQSAIKRHIHSLWRSRGRWCLRWRFCWRRGNGIGGGCGRGGGFGGGAGSGGGGEIPGDGVGPDGRVIAGRRLAADDNGEIVGGAAGGGQRGPLKNNQGDTPRRSLKAQV